MKLVLQISGGIILAAIILVGGGIAVVSGVAGYSSNSAEKAMFEGIEIDCEKRYSVARIEAERRRRCE